MTGRVFVYQCVSGKIATEIETVADRALPRIGQGAKEDACPATQAEMWRRSRTFAAGLTSSRTTYSAGRSAVIDRAFTPHE